MKRFKVLLLVMILLVNSSLVYGAVEDKLSNHWSRGEIDVEFLAYYFPYLAKDDFDQFSPSKVISQYNFNLSSFSLFKEYGYKLDKSFELGDSNSLSRGYMVASLGNKLVEFDIKGNQASVLPFMDTFNMDKRAIELLKILYANGIVKGDSNSVFAPERNLSQAEAIIILQRVEKLLKKSSLPEGEIPFEVLSIVQSFNNQEEIVTIRDGEKILVTVTKEFPTPGYGMTIKKIAREKNGFKIYFDIKPPSPDTIQLQVITYKTITIEIDKEFLGEGPYNFMLDGYNTK